MNVGQRLLQQRAAYLDLLLRRAEETGGDERYLDRLESILFPATTRRPSGLGWPAPGSSAERAPAFKRVGRGFESRPGDVTTQLPEDPRTSYWHTTCGKITTITDPVFAALVDTENPPFATLFCAHCNEAGPIGPAGEFHWCDRGNIATMAPLRQQKVGT